MVVQLGDVGTGPTSGSPEAFDTAKAFMSSFETPFKVITGTYAVVRHDISFSCCEQHDLDHLVTD